LPVSSTSSRAQLVGVALDQIGEPQQHEQVGGTDEVGDEGRRGRSAPVQLDR
jgi:hypothetical protein